MMNEKNQCRNVEISVCYLIIRRNVNKKNTKKVYHLTILYMYVYI